jgi:hypothetical protein
MEEEARRVGDGDQFDAARHAESGFPLVRSLLGDSNATNRHGEGDDTRAASSPSDSGTVEPASAISPVEIAAGRRRRRQRVARAAALASSARHRGTMAGAALDTVTMMMRGISEEEQIAMAIAASLQEQSNTTSDENAMVDNNVARSSSIDDSLGSSSSEESSPSRLGDGGILSSVNTHDQPLSGSSVMLNTATQESAAQENGDEATTITELARVVTDNVGGSEGTGFVTPPADD